jgi:cell division protein FtsI (penicillin-binding protein 3)
MTPQDKNKTRLRIRIIRTVFAAAFFMIGAKAVQLQVFRSSLLSEKAAGEYQHSVTLTGKRGTIFDARMREMAVTVDVTSMGAFPARINTPRKTARAVSAVLQTDPAALTRKLTTRKRFTWIKRKATPRETKAIRRLKLPGIDFITEHRRFYPNTTLAAQVLGFTGMDGRGLEGIEFYYDAYLQESTEVFTIRKDALGRGFGAETGPLNDRSGCDLVLTLDRTIQFIAERALEAAVIKNSAASGIAVVMAPRTGAVLALAHYPFFNPNAFGKYDRQRWRNRAITDAFEPGSTMKIFSVAAALERRICTPKTRFNCEKGAYKLGDAVVHDVRAHGWLSLHEVVKYSSNIGAVKVGEMVGADALHSTLSDFGFGRRTRIGCPGETAGSLLPSHRWSVVDLGAISYGHGISVSAIQLVTAVSAIANDGVLMQPYIVRAVTDPDGNAVKSFGPTPVRRVLSKTTARTIKQFMVSVVMEGGTGVRASLDNFVAGGKTGTSIKIDDQGEYDRERYIASFTGFVPADRPEIAILVVVDEPKLAMYGGEVAAPVFKRIARETLNYMNIPPNRTDERLTAARYAAPPLKKRSRSEKESK